MAEGTRVTDETIAQPPSPSRSAAENDVPPNLHQRRMKPEDREKQIVRNAIAVFSRDGLGASTRDLAKALGVTQPLLYRYFATKDDLIERVYNEVFFTPWNENWERWLADRSVSLPRRMKRYLKDYATFTMRSEVVRLHMYAGLARSSLTHRFIDNLRSRHFHLIARELRHDYGDAGAWDDVSDEELIELIWATHSSVFYMGVRKWIYDVPPFGDIERLIDLIVDTFFGGISKAFKEQRDTHSRT